MTGPSSRPAVPEVVVGIDGARRGWVGAVLTARAGDQTLQLVLADTLVDVVDAASAITGARPGVVAVDMPVALTDGPRRAADAAARAALGPRRASIFSPPPSGALAFADDAYAEANAWAKAHHGTGISKQAWYLVPRIREALAWRAEQRRPVLHESSPELAFAALAGTPLTHAKTTWTGLTQRIELLEAAGIAIPSAVGPAGNTAPDDVVDAAALAWSARRIGAGTASFAPAEGDHDRIWW